MLRSPEFRLPVTRGPERALRCRANQNFLYLGAVLIQNLSLQHWQGAVHNCTLPTHRAAVPAPQDDAYTHGIPRGANLYDNHPAYFEHRVYGGTHGVRFFLLSSSGMGMKVCGDGESVTSLEYSVIGSMFDF
jgi:hypothetical protein